MRHTLKDLLILSILVIFISFLVWIPHILKISNFYNLNFSRGFSTIYQNFDGLEYVIIAKSFYNPDSVAKIPQPLPAKYFASHFPGYPLVIKLFAPTVGYLKSMLFVSLISTIASVCIFYLLLREFDLTASPLWLSLLFLVLPARWLIVHSVGSPEPLFILFTLLAVYFFLKSEALGDAKFLWLSAVSGSLAVLVRPPGIILFLALLLYSLGKSLKTNEVKIKEIGKNLSRFLPFLIMPTALFGIFFYFQLALGDFFAYFHSGDNIHLAFPPFQVFNQHQFWVGDIWLEDIIYIFTVGFLGGLRLLRSKTPVAGVFVLVYLLATIFVAHRDIARYSLPIFPFILISFEKILISREFKIVMVIITLALYLYTQNFLLGNVAPVPNLDLYN